MRRPKLTPEQEGEVYRRAKAGARYADIQAWLASQGTSLAKSSISELRLRVERRALVQPPPDLPDEYIDPRTGARVEVSDDMILAYVQRSIFAEVFAHRATPAQQRSAARIVLRTMSTRRKLRTPILSHRR